MRRREFITLAGAMYIRADWALAQTTGGARRLPVIAILALDASANDDATIKTFVAALAKLDYVDGKSAIIVSRYAAGEQQALPKLAEELIALKPDVIVADAPSPIRVAEVAAPGVPIVGAAMGSPVEQGLIKSFSHPGGDVTGIASQVEDIFGKLLELGIDIVPGAKGVGLLVDPSAAGAKVILQHFQAAAEQRGIALYAAEAHGPGELDGAIHQLANAGAAFMCIAPSPLAKLNQRQIAQSAIALRMPTITNIPETADTGILLGYGVDPAENFRRAATFVDKILKGAKPGDLPVEFSTKLKVVVNSKTAKALGLTIPPTILAMADEVIE